MSLHKETLWKWAYSSGVSAVNMNKLIALIENSNLMNWSSENQELKLTVQSLEATIDNYIRIIYEREVSNQTLLNLLRQEISHDNEELEKLLNIIENKSNACEACHQNEDEPKKTIIFENNVNTRPATPLMECEANDNISIENIPIIFAQDTTPTFNRSDTPNSSMSVDDEYEAELNIESISVNHTPTHNNSRRSSNFSISSSNILSGDHASESRGTLFNISAKSSPMYSRSCDSPIIATDPLESEGLAQNEVEPPTPKKILSRHHLLRRTRLLGSRKTATNSNECGKAVNKNKRGKKMFKFGRKTIVRKNRKKRNTTKPNQVRALQKNSNGQIMIQCDCVALKKGVRKYDKVLQDQFDSNQESDGSDNCGLEESASLSDGALMIQRFLPIESIHDLEVFNENLKIEDFKTEFMNHCRKMLHGSVTTATFLRDCLRLIICDEVLITFSKGLYGKALPFRQMVFTCIQEAWTTSSFNAEKVKLAIHKAINFSGSRIITSKRLETNKIKS